MKVLYLGDIMGQPGRVLITSLLPKLKTKHKIDLVIAQAENVTHGKGLSPGHMRDLQRAGVDFFTGGNHTIERPAIKPFLSDPQQPVIAPINQVGIEPGWGAKKISTKFGNVLIASLLGQVFPTPVQTTNPLLAADNLLKDPQNQDVVATIFNFHADLSSEKRVIGYYLDGRVSAVIGDHWHVASADAMVLPKGTAHITDVGMCGTLHSSLGVSKEIIIARWRDGAKLKNDIAEGPPYQLNAVIIDVNIKTKLASSIESLRLVVEKLE